MGFVGTIVSFFYYQQEQTKGESKIGNPNQKLHNLQILVYVN